jgi:hypothetical protein
VAAYLAALEERARDRVPLDWATAQTGLSNALATLGVRESKTAPLEQAVVAFYVALEERTRERADFGIPDLLRQLSDDCPKRKSVTIYDRCGVHCPDLPSFFLGKTD